MNLFSLLSPLLASVELDEPKRIEYGDPVTIAYNPYFQAVHSDPEPTDDPRFTWMLPFYGSAATDLVKNYVDDMQASGRGALIGLLAEGFDTINEVVVEYYPGEPPKITRTYVWDTPQIDFSGDELTIRRRKVNLITAVETPQNFRLWIVFKPVKIYVIPS